jgi:hypothetical protein
MLAAVRVAQWFSARGLGYKNIPQQPCMRLKNEFFFSHVFYGAVCAGKRGDSRTNDVITKSSPDLWHTRSSDVESNRGKGGKHWYTICLCTPRRRRRSHQLGRWSFCKSCKHTLIAIDARERSNEKKTQSECIKWCVGSIHTDLRQTGLGRYSFCFMYLMACAAEGIMGFPLFAI